MRYRRRDPVVCGNWRSAIVLFGMLVSSFPAQARNFTVNVGGSNQTFTPAVSLINVGDTITFINKGGFHNVVAADGSFRCARGCDGDGNGGDGNADSSSWIAVVKFSQPQSLVYFCETHGSPTTGMRARILVQVQTPVRLLEFEVD